MEKKPDFAIVIPCLNEEGSIASTLGAVRRLPFDPSSYELIVVDDGSTDGTATILEEAADAHPALRVIRHGRNQGYGAALKTGIRAAHAELIVITDADGTYPIDRIPDLVARAGDADMVVGARTGENVSIPLLRRLPKEILRRYACWLTGEPIPDLNSGMRVVRRSLVLNLWRVLPNTFSFTTTITVAALRRGERVEFIPVNYAPRVGRSKIKPVRDTLRFIQLLVRVGMYFAPLRVLSPFVFLFGIAFAASLSYDILVLRDLTEKTMILLLLCLTTALVALLADMIDKRSL